MDFGDALAAFFATEAGQLAMWVLVLPVIDFILGVAAALRDGTFELDRVAAVLGKHFPRVVGIWTLLVAGYVTSSWTLPVVDLPALTTIGVGAATAYLAETIGSILRSWGPVSGPALVTRDTQQPRPQG